MIKSSSCQSFIEYSFIKWILGFEIGSNQTDSNFLNNSKYFGIRMTWTEISCGKLDDIAGMKWPFNVLTCYVVEMLFWDLDCLYMSFVYEFPLSASIELCF